MNHLSRKYRLGLESYPNLLVHVLAAEPFGRLVPYRATKSNKIK
jgi:hypothetical protein